MKELPINHLRIIEEFVSADETTPVAVLVAANDEWSAQKAIELIKAAPLMYAALNDLQDAIVQLSRVVDLIHVSELDTAADAELKAERAIAAACGGMLQRDRMVKK